APTLLVDPAIKRDKDGTLTLEVPDTNVQVNYTLDGSTRSEEHTSELQSRENLVCRLLLEKKKELGGGRQSRLAHEEISIHGADEGLLRGLPRPARFRPRRRPKRLQQDQGEH